MKGRMHDYLITHCTFFRSSKFSQGQTVKFGSTKLTICSKIKSSKIQYRIMMGNKKPTEELCKRLWELIHISSVMARHFKMKNTFKDCENLDILVPLWQSILRSSQIRSANPIIIIKIFCKWPNRFYKYIDSDYSHHELCKYRVIFLYGRMAQI